MTRSIDLVSVIHQNLVTSSQIQLACTDSSLSTAGNCSAYSQKPIGFSASRAPCPFAPELCSSTEAITLDTGYIDSHLNLGINAPESDRVTLRKRVRCAPLESEKYKKEGVNGTYYGNMSNTDNSFTGYYYGKNRRVGSPYTYAFSNMAFQKSLLGTAADRYSYLLE